MRFVKPSIYKQLAENGVEFLVDYFEGELFALYEDIKEIAQNRKFTWSEAEAIYTADRYLSFVHERLSGIVMESSNIPKELENKVYSLIDLVNEITCYIEENFNDVYEKDYSKFAYQIV